MVAALQTHLPRSHRSELAQGHRPGRPHRPALRLIEGGQSTSATSSVAVNAGSMLAIVAVMATVMLVLVVRGVQGAPPASDWATLAPATASAQATSANGHGSGAVDQAPLVVTVGADDTWSSIVARVAPDADPVEVARRIASENGGYALREGQLLTVTP